MKITPMILVLLGILSCGLANAQGAVGLHSTGSVDERISIAIPAFATDPGFEDIGRELAAIVANDLRFSGLFLLAPGVGYPTTFKEMTEDANTIDFAAWRKTNIEYLVHGHVSVVGTRIVAKCRLFDIKFTQQVVGKSLSGTTKLKRQIAHEFSDYIVKFIDGIPGIASSQIFFSARAAGGKELFVADYDGADLEQMTHHGAISIKPKASPNGRKIAYLSYKDRYPYLYIYDRNTGKSQVLSKELGLNAAPTWSPDASRIAFVLSRDGNTEIYIKHLETGTLRRLTRNNCSESSPVFSPDGSEIAFVSDRRGSAQIFVMELDGSDQRRLSYQGGASYDPAWSPNGKHIAYAVEKGGEGLEIYMMDADGKNPMRLTDSRGGNESPSWSPDSRHIVFTSSRKGPPELFTVTIATGEVRIVPGLPGVAQGSFWGPRQ